MKKSILLLIITLLVSSWGEEKKERNLPKLGGYGEMHLNYKIPEEGKADSPVLDFHRWVLFINHNFNEKWGLAAELELEHNFVEGGESKGELELEQAFVEFRPYQFLNINAGVILASAGLYNEEHEPTRFLSVERPNYSKVIIPTTWFGNGASVHGNIKGAAEYRFVVMEGLDDTKFRTKDGLRKGRQKGYKSDLSNALFNGMVNFTLVPGLKVGGSFALNALMRDNDNSHTYDNALLLELHARYKAHGLWVAAELGNVKYNAKDGKEGDLEQSQGFYLDLGYDIARIWKSEELSLYPFIRYTQFNPAGTVFGDNKDGRGDTSRFMLGLALYPIKNVAIKFDYAFENYEQKKETTGLLNVGIGYEF